jgi:hypothetical protein
VTGSLEREADIGLVICNGLLHQTRSGHLTPQSLG